MAAEMYVQEVRIYGVEKPLRVEDVHQEKSNTIYTGAPIVIPHDYTYAEKTVKISKLKIPIDEGDNGHDF